MQVYKLEITRFYEKECIRGHKIKLFGVTSFEVAHKGGELKGPAGCDKGAERW